MRSKPFLIPKCAAFIEEWAAIAANGSIPTSQDFLRHVTLPIMRQAFILERDGAQLTIRYMGVSLVDLFNYDFTGTSFTASILQDEPTGFESQLVEVLGDPAGLHLTTYAVTTKARRVEFEAVVLPFRTEPGKPDRWIFWGGVLEPLRHEEISHVVWPKTSRRMNVDAQDPNQDGRQKAVSSTGC